jgi:hypothetical protein
MSSFMQRREGFALAVAMFAIVIIGAMIAGAFFASTQEYRIGRNSITQARAMAAAEAGQAALLSTWNKDWNSSIANGETTDWVTLPVDDGAGSSARVRFTRLDQTTFWVVSEGVAGGTDYEVGARRRTGAVLRLGLPQINFLGALTTRGVTRIGGSSFINGHDSNPTGWACGAPGESMPGIAIDDPSKIETSGCSDLSCVAGDPKVEGNPDAADDSTYFEYGSQDWDDLVALSTVRISGGTHQIEPVVNGGVCVASNTTNWGEPTKGTGSPCESYYPIIYSAGNLNINGHRGQGILLVEGDLTIQGGFQFFGPVIVKGSLKTTGTGGHINGAVMAANVDLETNTVLGNAVVNYSSCALATVLSNTSMPKHAADRAWADLF